MPSLFCNNKGVWKSSVKKTKLTRWRLVISRKMVIKSVVAYVTKKMFRVS